MSENIITGLDIGSYAIRVAGGQVTPSEGPRTQIHIIGAVEVPSDGVHKGTITGIEDAVSSISKALEQGERMTGVPLSASWVGIAGHHVLVQESKGVIGVGRTDGEVRDEDVERALEAARTVARPTNYEILHVIPKGFTVDSQHGIKDPVGMNGIRLEVDAVIVQALSSQIKNLTKCIYRTGLDIEDLVYAPLAGSEVVTTPRQKELGVCVVNIGASTTTMIVFEEGDILHTAVLPIGSDHITNDIAIGLRTSLEVAEAVKVNYGSAVADQVPKKDVIPMNDFGLSGEAIECRYVAEIIEARVEEICERIDAELAKVDRSGMLPAGIVATGGGVRLAGVVEVMKRVLRLPVAYGQLHGVTSVIDHAADPAFSTAVGLVMWGAQIRGSSSRGGNVFAKFKSMDKVSEQMRKWLRSLIP
ncbi:MAG: cell division protein FtsA [Patescibacteria group bacterium]